ncbi:hypothetical protein HMPREF0299_5416 [Corynebacterium matruchotii ATCC 14266]|uniref:Uncharacterized protein n=1 Tax=Corynebacterium matruchotii ATCC 14266 TaxID=553207 RepID=E0DIA6_9CORY|nr:hypothetical protein HMPREF0299_5416 [Corynebacterium matruchotii ATCC 14266]
MGIDLSEKFVGCCFCFLLFRFTCVDASGIPPIFSLKVFPWDFARKTQGFPW